MTCVAAGPSLNEARKCECITCSNQECDGVGFFVFCFTFGLEWNRGGEVEKEAFCLQ